VFSRGWDVSRLDQKGSLSGYKRHKPKPQAVHCLSEVVVPARVCSLPGGQEDHAWQTELVVVVNLPDSQVWQTRSLEEVTSATIPVPGTHDLAVTQDVLPVVAANVLGPHAEKLIT
jgi:hypothetical protein